MRPLTINQLRSVQRVLSSSHDIPPLGGVNGLRPAPPYPFTYCQRQRRHFFGSSKEGPKTDHGVRSKAGLDSVSRSEKERVQLERGAFFSYIRDWLKPTGSRTTPPSTQPPASQPSQPAPSPADVLSSSHPAPIAPPLAPSPILASKLKPSRPAPPLYRPRYPPGIPTLHRLITYLDRKIGRIPNDVELLSAFSGLVSWYDYSGPGPQKITDEHAYGLLRAYEYLVRRKETVPSGPERVVNQQGKEILRKPVADGIELDLETLRAVLRIVQNGATGYEKKLGIYVFEDIGKQVEGGVRNREDYYLHIKMLCAAGSAVEAFNVAKEAWIQHGETTIESRTWNEVLAGYSGIFSSSGKQAAPDSALLEAWGEMEKLLGNMDSEKWHQRVLYYCRLNDVDTALQLFKNMSEATPKIEPILDTYEEVIQVCCRMSQFEEGQAILDSLLDKVVNIDGIAYPGQQPNWNCWGVILRSASLFGNGVDPVRKILAQITKLAQKPSSAYTYPDISLLNTVIESALLRKDYTLASNLLQLNSQSPDPKKLQIDLPFHPNRETISCKFQIYIAREEVDGARNVYESLLHDFDSVDPEIQSFEAGLMIQALYSSNKHDKSNDINYISNMLSDLSDRNIPLSITTISSLLQFYLSQDLFAETLHLFDTIITPHTTLLSHAERTRLIIIIVTYIKSPNTSLLGAWDAYQILHRNFPYLEVPFHTRLSLMDLFFDLARSDLAIVIFMHIEKLWELTHFPSRPPKDPTLPSYLHPPLSTLYPSLLTASPKPAGSTKIAPRTELTPTLKETLYMHTLTGLSAPHNADFPHLRLIHNHLKTDPYLPPVPSTTLLNTLMMAYTRLGMYDRAIRFWGTIKRSTAGPDDASISLYFDLVGRSEKEDWVREAVGLWRGMRGGMGITPSVGNGRAYVEMLCRGKLGEEAVRVVKEEMIWDGEVDQEILETLCNLTPLDLHTHITHWLETEHPGSRGVWAKFQRKRREREEVEEYLWEHGGEDSGGDGGGGWRWGR